MPRTFTSAYSTTQSLTTPARDNPATVASSGDIDATNGVGIAGNASYAWTLSNYGTVESTAFSGVSFAAGGYIINQATGLIQGVGATSPMNERDAIDILGAAGTVVNLGKVNGTGFSGSGIVFRAGGTVSNAAGATVSGYFDGVYIAGGAGTVTNSGLITATTRHDGITLLAGGAITNETGGYIHGARFGVYLYKTAAAATITNAGGGVITGGNNGVVIAANDTANNTIVNNGTIAGIGATGTTGVAITLGGSGVDVVNNGASGLITGNADGFASNTNSETATIVNSGVIRATELSTGGTTSFSFGVIIGSGIVNNSGTITDAAHYNGISVQVNSGGTVLNTGTISNFGTNNASAVNFLSAGGLIVNGAPGQTVGTIAAYHYGIGFSAPATIANAGTLTIVNYGLIESTQTVVNAGSLAGRAIDAAGANVRLMVDNFGTIASSQTQSAAGTVGVAEGIEMSGGTVVNEAGALISAVDGNAIGVSFVTGNGVNITNLGTISNANTNHSTIYVGRGGGTITNGAAAALITSLGRSAISFGTTGGTGIIVNSGTISSTSPAGGDGVYLGQGGTVVNQAGGLITSYIDAVNISGAAGTVLNSGTIAHLGSGTSGEAVYLGAGGLVVNYAGGLLSGARVGQSAGAAQGYPGVVDAGTAAAATVVNLGTITNPNNSDGVNLLGGGLLINGSSEDTTALISAIHAGVYIGGRLGVPTPGAVGTVVNYGTIQNSSSLGPGIELVSGGTIENLGLIASGRTGVSFRNTPGTLYNFGTVVSTVPTTYAHGVAVYLQNGGLINNEASGLITAYRAAIDLGIAITGSGTTLQSATVVNAGTIVGSTGITVGIYDTASNTIVNSGTIIGTAGTAIQFRNNYNQLTLDPGSVISGSINGGGGKSDTIELAAGEGTGTFYGIQLTNFTGTNQILVDVGASWVMSGFGTLGAGYTIVDSGALTFAGDLNIYGPLMVQAGGVVTYADLQAGGEETVRFGGLDISASLDNLGFELVFGSAVATEIDGGGNQIVAAGGVSVNVTVDAGGVQTVFGTASGTVLEGGIQVIGPGNAQAVQRDGQGNDEGVAVNTTISGGGVQTVVSGGVASGSTVSAGGQETVIQGGTMVGATIAGGILDLQSGATAAGTIAFAGFAGAGGGTLEIDGTTMPTTPIGGFIFGDTIDLRALTFVPGAMSATVQNNILSVSSAGTVVDQLTLSGTPDGTQFTVTSDVAGGTAIGRVAPKIAFMTGSFDPWSAESGGFVVPSTDPGSAEGAMNTAFGAGNWTKIQGFTASALTAGYQFIYIDGSDGDSAQFDSFINSNLAAIENFVAGGGRLFINAARWPVDVAAADYNLNLGFGGVTLDAGNYSNIDTALQPTNPIFNGPNGSTGTSWTGNHFSHDFITGNGLNNLIQGTAANTGIALAGEHYGAGYVLFGGLTLPFFHSPQPQGDILGANILDYAAGTGTIGIPAPTDVALSPASESGVAGSNDTNVTTPVITGDGVAGDTVTVFDGSTVVGTGAVQASGTWAVTTSVLADGVHSITATESDTNGDVSAPSSALSLTIDTQPPQTTAAALGVAANAGATAIGIVAPTDNESTFTITVNTLPTNGTMTLGDGVTPVTVGETLSVAQLTGLDFTPNAADNGTKSSFTYTVTDLAGNSSIGTATLVVGVGSLFSFVFSYNDGKDYFEGTVGDNGSFGYTPGETLKTSAGVYTILGNLGSTGEAAGTVFVTDYFHDAPGQASSVPVDTAAGVPDSTTGLGNVSDAVLGLDGLSHPFSASSEVNFNANALYGFVFDYTDGREFYSGTVATAQGSSPTIPTSAIGSYSVFFEGLTGRAVGSVSVDRFVVGSTSFIPKTSGGNGNTDGTGGLGSEVDSITVNGAISVFSDTLEPTVFLATPSLPSTLPPTANSVLQSEVYDLYADVFNRIPDAAGLATYTNDLANGESIGTLRAVLANSAEAQSYLNTLFDIVFSRPIDASGDATYTADLVNGSSLSAIQAIIAQSPEAQARIQTFYQSVLNRSADPAGLVNAMGFLAAGGSLQAIQIIFAHSAEAAGDLANIFKPVFGRSPDAAELVGMEDQLAANGASQSSVVPGGGVTKVVPPAGSQTLTAAPGTPTEFDFSNVAFTADTINGFDPTQDALVLPKALASSYTQSASGGSTLISFIGDPSQSILVSSVASNQFGSTNFRFA